MRTTLKLDGDICYEITDDNDQGARSTDTLKILHAALIDSITPAEERAKKYAHGGNYMKLAWVCDDGSVTWVTKRKYEALNKSSLAKLLRT
jgi:hypothetical protein